MATAAESARYAAPPNNAAPPAEAASPGRPVPGGPRAGPPGPTPRQMLRDVPTIFRDPLGYLSRLRARHGPVVAFPTPSSAAWFVDDPGAVDRVLRTNAANYTKRTVQYDALSRLTGEGLLTSDNPVWRDHRRRIAPAFHRRTLDRLVGSVAAAADGLDRDLAHRLSGRAAGRLDLDGPLLAATLDVVSRGLFSAELGERHGTRRSAGRARRCAGRARGGAVTEADVAGAVVTGLEEVIRRATRPLRAPASWPTPANRRLARALGTLDGAVAAVVTARDGLPEPTDPDLLDLLLASLPDHRAVRDEAVTLVVAGHETVASAMEWAAHLLAGAPAVQERVAAEADAAFADGPVGLATLSRLPLARAVVDETLRLYPPAWVVTRRAVDADELAGWAMPAGTLVIISPWVRHRDPAAWPEPLRFDPARFESGRFESAADRAGSGSASGDPARPDTAYLPFGLGPRLCIGRDFALLEATLLVARLARGWRLAPAGRRPVRPRPRVTVRPRGGLPLLVSRRRDVSRRRGPG